MLVISKAQREAMRQSLETTRCDALARRIRAAFEQELAHWEDTALRAQVRRSVARLKLFGIKQEQFLTHFAIWDIFLGEGFEVLDPNSELVAILHADRAEPMKFHDFQIRLNALLKPAAEQPLG